MALEGEGRGGGGTSITARVSAWRSDDGWIGWAMMMMMMMMLKGSLGSGATAIDTFGQQWNENLWATVNIKHVKRRDTVYVCMHGKLVCDHG